MPKKWLKIKNVSMNGKRWETPENGYYNLAKVRVEGSNPFARSNFLHNSNPLTEPWLAGTLAAAVAGQHPAPELCWASKPMTACRTNAPFHRSSFLARSLVARAEIWDLGVEVPKGHG